MIKRREILQMLGKNGLGAVALSATGLSSTRQAHAALPKGVKMVSYQTKNKPGTIVISNSKRQLWLVHEDDQALLYPVAVGRPEEQWTGTLPVTNKIVGPTWRPTPSMREKDPNLPNVVKPGPKNPLGTHAIYLGWTFYRIHGTNSPRSIGRAASSGCFRMFNSHVEDLFARVHFGAPCIVVR